MEIKPIVTEDFVVLDDESMLSELIGKMKTFEKRVGLVFRKDKYLGLIEKKKLLKSRIDVTKTKIKNYVQNTPILNENADIIETAYLMYQSNIKHVPVEREKKIIGVVSSLDLVRLAIKLPEMKKVKVKDIKLSKTAKLNKTDPIATAMTIMHQERVDHLPVFDQGKVYGIISFKDILRRYLNWSPKRDVSAKFNQMANSGGALANMPKLDQLPVSDFSTNDNLFNVQSNESLVNATKVMVDNRLSDLLVMENNEFVGLLTVKNILRNVSSLKVPKNYNIKFVGLNDTKLNPYQKYTVKKIASNEAFKLQRKINNEMNLVIHLKDYDKGGKQKFSIHLRIETPGQMISSEQHDWELETALRKVFNNAKNSVKKKFRGDSSWDKPYE
ncbi:CBS domain-containing protein [Candidatus Woesearchaeota archaeon]|jgi:CBS domain-containing protein|nr:CBS domain-containing protein [Candidatus Woesearchaeota archaeon]